MADSDSPLHALLIKIKVWKPHKLRVTTADGETRDVCIPGTGKRRSWGRLEEMLQAMAWVKVEGLSKNNELMGMHENTDYEADDLEDLEGAPSRMTGELSRLAGLFLRGQDHVLKRYEGMMETQAKAFGQVLQVQGQVLDTLAGRLVTTEEKYADVLDVLQSNLGSAAGDGTDSGDAMEDFFKMIRGVKEVKSLASPAADAAAESKPNGKAS